MNRAAHATLASASCTCVLSIAVNERPNVQHWLAQYRVKVKFSFFPRILTLNSASYTVSICMIERLVSCMRSCMATLVIDVVVNGQNFCTPPRDLLKKVRAEISASRPRRVKRWPDIPLDIFTDFAQSMPTRIAAVIAANGDATKY